MLNYVDWNNAINIRQGKLDDIEMRMSYRKLEIRGSYDPEALNGNWLKDETRDKLASDPELIRLNYISKMLKDEIYYIKSTGEEPPETQNNSVPHFGQYNTDT